MVCLRTFSKRTLAMPKLSAFIGTKYSFHTFGHLFRPVIMESPKRKMLAFELLIIYTMVTMIFDVVRFIKTVCWN